METEFEQLQQRDSSDVAYEIYRAACVKEFEIVLGQSGNLLKKRLRPFLASNRLADQLTFKGCFRRAAKHDLNSIEACERWLQYRDSRYDTVHDYGAGFAEVILRLLPSFITDSKELAEVLEDEIDD